MDKEHAVEVTNYLYDAVRSAFMTELDLSGESFTLVGKGEEPPHDGSRPYYEVNARDVISGHLAADVAKHLGNAAKGGMARVALVLSWFWDETRNAPENALLLVPALLDDEGALHCPTKWTFTPVIPRAFLREEYENPASGTYVGSYQDYSSYVDRHQATMERIAKDASKDGNDGLAWKTYLTYCRSLYEHVTRSAQAREALGVRDAFAPEGTAYVLLDTSVSAGMHIIDLYKAISHGSPVSEAYEAFVGMRERIVNTPPLTNLEQMKAHCGGMNRDYGAQKSQREAVRAACNRQHGGIAAISGPPGTGKTTLLQSVVANEVTRSVLEDDLPPVIVGTSTNNQAITNIIDSFSTVEQDEGMSVFCRWLPDPADLGKPLHSMGVYTPSDPKRDKAVRAGYLVGQFCYPFVKTDPMSKAKLLTDLYEVASGEEYLRAARAYFDEHARAIGIENASYASLRKRLLRVDCLRCQLIDEVASGGDCEDARTQLNALGVAAPLAPDDCRSLEDLDKALDTKVRTLEFWLALHCLEWSWMNLESQPSLGSHTTWIKREKSFTNLERAYHRQVSCLTPLQVMTPYLLPREFKCWQRGQTTYPKEPIDLLIIDEAGQVDTMVVAASLALAKRVVVVGDEQQLSPIWTREPEEDLRRATHYLGDDPQGTFERMKERGITASKPSSCMRAARSASTDDVLLLEHWRCREPIISYCNDLVYHNKLDPMRREPMKDWPQDLPVPAMSFVPVEGEATRRLGSWVNQTEADRILAWVDDHYEDLCASYEGKPRNEVLGILAPFRQQARLIARGLKNRGLDGDILCNTAHALQGAERKVILFSLVYGDGDATGFVERQPNLMNVAVSRAKDAFVLFGSQAVLQAASPNGTLGKLARHCGAVGSDGPALAISACLRQWAQEEDLPEAVREAFSKATSRDANKALADLGYLAGEAGDWQITEAGKEIGIVREERTNKDGESYVATLYPPATRAWLRDRLAELLA